MRNEKKSENGTPGPIFCTDWSAQEITEAVRDTREHSEDVTPARDTFHDVRKVVDERPIQVAYGVLPAVTMKFRTAAAPPTPTPEPTGAPRP
ncbi:hypothetical protein [Corynebacterium kalidii]|uniref:Uncharacterized protein n=1 Tax=Corynebacterium kalidii TaxID=2931982 RepID=A0A9X1WFX7_9CORY|nr:hypothetical protein [Corynebacterium kalidii]MCJ7858294.1 hypothetical protein [Corynebacterium kalidii]